ncbi:MAG: SAM hydrolase/SAM-dependent halogenase family protein [Solirubrobacteraceae bacterium]
MTDIPVISFLSDYGLADEFVGVCHGVMLRRCPGAQLIDITHAIPRHDIVLGALTLSGAIQYLPAAVHLAVVDPEVGSVGEHARRAVALRTASQQLLVGPDNGLLAAACERLGGALEAVDIGRSPERLEPVAATFHGRDIFAPVAAALAAGATLEEVGEPLDVSELRALELPTAELGPQGLRAHVLHCDHFGNVILDATHEQLAQIGLRIGQRLLLQKDSETHEARYARAFADVADGELLLYEDAQRMAALAVNRGSAAELLKVERGTSLLLLSL